MKRYEFSKLYADVITDDGAVVTAYLAWVCVLGRWYARASCRVYMADGRKLAFPDLHAPPEPRFDVPDGRLVVESGDLRLDVATELAGFSPRPLEPELEWSVSIAKGPARVWIPGLGELCGTGYVDRVVVTRPTRLLGLARLHWGHANVGRSTVAYTALELQDGRRWSPCAVYREGRFEDASVEVRIDDGGTGEVTLGPLVARFDSPRTLESGSAFASEKMAGTLDRVASRLVGGRTMQTRWLSRARIDGEPATGWAIHERVEFG